MVAAASSPLSLTIFFGMKEGKDKYSEIESKEEEARANTDGKEREEHVLVPIRLLLAAGCNDPIGISPLILLRKPFPSSSSCIRSS